VYRYKFRDTATTGRRTVFRGAKVRASLEVRLLRARDSGPQQLGRSQNLGSYPNPQPAGDK